MLALALDHCCLLNDGPVDRGGRLRVGWLVGWLVGLIGREHGLGLGLGIGREAVSGVVGEKLYLKGPGLLLGRDGTGDLRMIGS